MVGTQRTRQGRGLRRGALVLLGGLLGVLGARYLLVGSGWSLLPWGLVAVLAGISADSRRQAALDGGLYGFVLSLVFMIAGYAGEAPLAGRLPFFALLGLFGAACAAVLSLAGRLARTRIHRGPRPGAPT
jgi:hypothetical protein